ncbi:hypothetical protein [Microbacterium sp. EST19A]|uniref:hypothetical protein n=1 Tax=Microbacterium sp. EST19A TaxID=2862681 RepID=UPI001CBF1C96|nr:hypothetical protein [Microbacterium sp. EST19A]
MSLTSSPADSLPQTEVGQALGVRLEYLITQTQEFIHMTGYEARKDRVKIEGVPIKSALGDRADYHVDVRGALTNPIWSEQLRDIISRARSLLDNVMWEAVAGEDKSRYSNQERKAIYFPIAHTAGDWAAFERTKHAQQLSAAARADFRSVQPFVTGAPVVAWLNKTNNRDKHRYPLRIATLPDRLFAMVFAEQVAAIPGEDAPGIRWAPIVPIVDGAHLVTCSAPVTVGQLEPVELPVALCIEIEGDWIDLQVFLQDVVEFAARATAVLLGGSTAWADEHRQRFDAERAQMLDFQRAIARNDMKAEQRWRNSGPGALGYFPQS